LLVCLMLISFIFSTNSSGPVQNPIQLSSVPFPFRVHDFVTWSSCFFDSYEVFSFPRLLPISLTRTMLVAFLSFLPTLPLFKLPRCPVCVVVFKAQEVCPNPVFFSLSRPVGMFVYYVPTFLPLLSIQRTLFPRFNNIVCDRLPMFEIIYCNLRSGGVDYVYMNEHIPG
jgi:hypothetical protein